MFDPGIKDRPKVIAAAAGMLIKLEFTKSKDGWEIVKPMVDELFNDTEYAPLKKEYEKQKALQLKASLWNDSDFRYASADSCARRNRRVRIFLTRVWFTNRKQS